MTRVVGLWVACGGPFLQEHALNTCSERMFLVLVDVGQTSVLRALAPTTPTYVFPAMNTFMYEHPLTAEHIRIVRDVIGYNVVGPIGKTLACGDVGAYLCHWMRC